MDVEWIFEPAADEQRRDDRAPAGISCFRRGKSLGKRLVLDYFVHGVAAKTLARMKALAEAAHHSNGVHSHRRGTASR